MFIVTLTSVILSTINSVNDNNDILHILYTLTLSALSIFPQEKEQAAYLLL